MSNQVEEFANRFEIVNDEMIAIIERCSEEELRLPSIAEGWTLAAVAHHVAIVYPGFASTLEGYARGESYSPSTTMERLDEMNAEHAREYAQVPRDDVLDKLRSGGEQTAAAMRTIPDDNLANPAGVYGGNEFSVEQALEYIIIGHTAVHLASIQETLDGTDF